MRRRQAQQAGGVLPHPQEAKNKGLTLRHFIFASQRELVELAKEKLSKRTVALFRTLIVHRSTDLWCLGCSSVLGPGMKNEKVLKHPLLSKTPSLTKTRRRDPDTDSARSQPETRTRNHTVFRALKTFLHTSHG